MPGESGIEQADRAIDASFRDAPVGEPTVTCPYRSPIVVDPERTDWVEFELWDEDLDEPVPDEAYELTLTDGRVLKSRLDRNGMVRVEGIPPGECTIYFPDLDHEMTAQTQPPEERREPEPEDEA